MRDCGRPAERSSQRKRVVEMPRRLPPTRRKLAQVAAPSFGPDCSRTRGQPASLTRSPRTPLDPLPLLAAGHRRYHPLATKHQRRKPRGIEHHVTALDLERRGEAVPVETPKRREAATVIHKATHVKAEGYRGE